MPIRRRPTTAPLSRGLQPPSTFSHARRRRQRRRRRHRRRHQRRRRRRRRRRRPRRRTAIALRARACSRCDWIRRTRCLAALRASATARRRARRRRRATRRRRWAGRPRWRRRACHRRAHPPPRPPARRPRRRPLRRSMQRTRRASRRHSSSASPPAVERTHRSRRILFRRHSASEPRRSGGCGPSTRRHRLLPPPATLSLSARRRTAQHGETRPYRKGWTAPPTSAVWRRGSSGVAHSPAPRRPPWRRRLQRHSSRRPMWWRRRRSVARCGGGGARNLPRGVARRSAGTLGLSAADLRAGAGGGDERRGRRRRRRRAGERRRPYTEAATVSTTTGSAATWGEWASDVLAPARSWSFGWWPKPATPPLSGGVAASPVIGRSPLAALIEGSPAREGFNDGDGGGGGGDEWNDGRRIDAAALGLHEQRVRENSIGGPPPTVLLELQALYCNSVRLCWNRLVAKAVALQLPALMPNTTPAGSPAAAPASPSPADGGSPSPAASEASAAAASKPLSLAQLVVLCDTLMAARLDAEARVFHACFAAYVPGIAEIAAREWAILYLTALAPALRNHVGGASLPQRKVEALVALRPLWRAMVSLQARFGELCNTAMWSVSPLGAALEPVSPLVAAWIDREQARAVRGARGDARGGAEGGRFVLGAAPLRPRRRGREGRLRRGRGGARRRRGVASRIEALRAAGGSSRRILSDGAPVAPRPRVAPEARRPDLDLVSRVRPAGASGDRERRRREGGEGGGEGGGGASARLSGREGPSFDPKSPAKPGCAVAAHNGGGGKSNGGAAGDGGDDEGGGATAARCHRTPSAGGRGCSRPQRSSASAGGRRRSTRRART